MPSKDYGRLCSDVQAKWALSRRSARYGAQLLPLPLFNRSRLDRPSIEMRARNQELAAERMASAKRGTSFLVDSLLHGTKKQIDETNCANSIDLISSMQVHLSSYT
ncbi:unnamed protein product [Toxocara canis]|uniref:Uncharacterized protein n=1 Tax=Toxocara canis TaxID=6265 RepID=A0A183V7H6_TOXCA|nr:unnamed protein product [Toxocara canis]